MSTTKDRGVPISADDTAAIAASTQSVAAHLHNGRAVADFFDGAKARLLIDGLLAPEHRGMWGCLIRGTRDGWLDPLAMAGCVRLADDLRQELVDRAVRLKALTSGAGKLISVASALTFLAIGRAAVARRLRELGETGDQAAGGS